MYMYRHTYMYACVYWRWLHSTEAVQVQCWYSYFLACKILWQIWCDLTCTICVLCMHTCYIDIYMYLYVLPFRVMYQLLVLSWLWHSRPTPTVRMCGWLLSSWRVRTMSFSEHVCCWERPGHQPVLLVWWWRRSSWSGYWTTYPR